MSLRCSLLGHSFGEAEIEREREEQGSEVVVTVREFEECERCGERKTITENKEVTAIQSPAPDLEATESDAGMTSESATAPEASTASESGTTGATGGSSSTGATGGGAGPSAGQSDGSTPSSSAASDATVGVETGAATDGEVTAAAGEDDAEIIGDSTASGGSSSGTSASESASDPANPDDDADSGGESDPAEGDFEEGPSAADDDGVILDDADGSADSSERTPGEWPEAETTHPADADDAPGEWPAVGREDSDEGYDAEPGGSGDADVQFGGGLTPESAPEVDEDEEVEFVNAEGDALQSKDASRGRTELSSGISAGAEAPSMSGASEDPDVDAEFVCPECDYRQAVDGSSLRAGDICPECGRGYLAQE